MSSKPDENPRDLAVDRIIQAYTALDMKLQMSAATREPTRPWRDEVRKRIRDYQRQYMHPKTPD